MKIFDLLILLLSLLIIGCSTTYRISDYPFRENFYSDFNNSAKDKELKITLNNDSTVTAYFGGKILNDSLFIITPVKINENEVKEIIYNNDSKSNKLFLNNGDTLTVKKTTMIPGSILFMDSNNSFESIPLNKVKKISYNDNWSGVPYPIIFGTIFGIPFGAIVGIIINKINPPNNTMPQSGSYVSSIEDDTINSGIIIGSIAGLITGGIICIEGYTYIYQFNP
jgi:hypothetical protein